MTKKWQFILLASVLLIGTIFAIAGCSAGKTAQSGDTVKVDYTLTLSDGTVVDTSEGKEPYEFTLGANQTIEGFDNAVTGMKIGQSKTVTLTADEAYGPRREDLIWILNRSEVQLDQEPEIGRYLEGTLSDGTPATVVITAFDETTITVDANHPLAGKDLTFKITLVEIVGT